MTTFQDLIIRARMRFESWLNINLPKVGVAAGIGITAWAIGSTLGSLTAEAQTIGWSTAIALLSAELGKDFVVSLVEHIRDEKLREEDIAFIVQAELDKNLDLPDLKILLDQLGILPAILEQSIHLNNAQLIESLQADLAAYPKLISTQTADKIQSILYPRIETLSKEISHLNERSTQILAILESFVTTPYRTPELGTEPPLQVFVSSLINELTGERQVLRQAIIGLGITKPWVFEFTPASTQLVEMSYIDKVRTCDFFVLIIDENVSSNVEKEFETALEYNRPIFAFIKKEKDDKDEQRTLAAKALISRIPTKWDIFSSPTDLALKARVAITDDIIRRVRDNQITLPDSKVQDLERKGNNLSRALLNLPSRRYTRLIGREEEIGTILQRLRNPDRTAPPVIAITALGGIGKTALAYEVTERALLEGLFDGLVWESAKSEELEGTQIAQLRNAPSLSIDSLVSAIARQLGYETMAQIPPGERFNRVKHILQTGSYLIVVDNLETIEAYEELTQQLHDLLNPSDSHQPSRALVTSREKLDITYIYDYYIQGLSKPATMTFIKQEAHDRSATGLLQAGTRVLDQIFKVTYGMPLAIKLIVSQFIMGIPLDTELGRLKGAKEDVLYELIYMRLWFKLSIPGQKVLIGAAAFASSITRSMLQPVSKTNDEEFEAAIPELVRMCLIEPTDHLAVAQRRYSIHPMTRWFINAPLRELWKKQKGDSMY